MNPNPTPTEPSKRLTPEKLEEIRTDFQEAGLSIREDNGHFFIDRGSSIVALIRDWPGMLSPDSERWCYMVCGSGNNVYFPTAEESFTAFLKQQETERERETEKESKDGK